MNSTLDPPNDGPGYNQGQETVGPYGYSIGISFGILLVLIIISYCYYIYSPRRADTNNNHNIFRRNSIDTTIVSSSDNDESMSIPQGLDGATLLAYPKLLYSQAKKHEGGCSASGCSICLQNHKDTDMLRLLPECGHFFHLECVSFIQTLQSVEISNAISTRNSYSRDASPVYTIESTDKNI